MPSHQAQFRLVYDGPALKARRMDVRELAPALLSAGELFQQANRVLNGDRASMSVYVNAEFVPGSFEIGLFLDQSLLDHAKRFLTGQEIVTAKQVLEQLFWWAGVPAAGLKGLFWLIKQLKGRKPDSIIYNDNRVFINTGNGPLSPDPRTYQLYSDEACRRAAEGVVQPLLNSGIESLEIRRAKKIIQTVTKAEADYFSMDLYEAERTVLLDDAHVAVLQIDRLCFTDEGKWTFSDGATAYSASIKDPAFKERIDSGEAFAKGDTLRARVHTLTWRTEKGKLQSEHTIEKVLEHSNAPEPPVQMVLDPSGNPSSTSSLPAATA